MGRRTPRFTGRSSGVSGLRRHLNQLAQAEPEAIRKEVIAKGRDPFIEGLIQALAEPGFYCDSCKRSGRERWAFRLYAELAEMVGMKVNIAEAIAAALGVGLSAARGSVETVSRAQGMSEPALCREMIQHLREYAGKIGCEWTELESHLSQAEVIENGGP